MSSPAPEPTDADLLARARGGERAALGELLRRFWPLLAGYLRKCCRVPDADTDDCIQETMLRAVRHNQKWDGNAAWLRTLAASAAADWRKKKRAAPAGEVVDLIAAPPPPPPAEPHPKLADCLRKLREQKPEYHAAVVAIYYDGREPSEVVAASDLIPTTLRTRLSKAREALRKCVGDPDE